MATGKVANTLKFIDNLNLTSNEFERLIDELDTLKELAYIEENKKEDGIKIPIIAFKHLA